MRSPTPRLRPAAPRLLGGLAELAADYPAIICDVWGVVHNGLRAWEAACDALKRYRRGGGKVLLVSNAPRPKRAVVQRLDALGVPRAAWDEVLTSGDMTRRFLETKPSRRRRVFHLGPERDSGLLDTLPREYEAPLEDAYYILLSGLRDDRSERPSDYRNEMRQWLRRGQRAVCANPDRQVQVGRHLIYCAGALAEQYERMGGEVLWFGKPHPPIYRAARKILGRKRILVIGDGPLTDIKGANEQNLDAVFVLGGLTAAGGTMPRSPAALATRLAKVGAHARYYCEHLRWNA